MNIAQKFKEFMSPTDEDEIIEYDERDVESLNEYEKAKSKKINNFAKEAKMVLFEPRAFEEVETVATCIKENKAVVVNLHKLTREYAQRTVDFLNGVLFALDGSMQKVGTNVILCTPKTIGVDGSINDEKNEG